MSCTTCKHCITILECEKGLFRVECMKWSRFMVLDKATLETKCHRWEAKE